MTRLIDCKKLGQQAEGLDFVPFPGSLGEKIYHNISKPAWQQWLQHQTMLINEYRLNTLEPKAREFLQQEMQKYFFGDGSERPEGYTPQEK